MIWAVLVEGVVICVLGLLVVALAHSYAGLASRVGATTLPGDATAGSDRTGMVASGASGASGATGESGASGASVAIRDLEGVTPDGETVLLVLAEAATDTLLAFLTSTCASCQRLWDELPDAIDSIRRTGVRLVIVVKGPEQESPARVVELATAVRDVDVVMSSGAWHDLAVPGSPYFALVQGASGKVVGQGTALRWQQVMDLIGVARGDARVAVGAKSRRDRRQEVDVDQVLLAAGVLPGDPSLYPTADARPPR